MATQTQTLRRPVVQAERVHDYLYDHHFVVSSERDHARATFKAHTGTDRVKRVPNYPTMFSELGHHPRFQMRLDVTDPVPKFISRQWRGYQDQHREALVRYTTFNYDPSVKVPSKDYGNAQVSGANRYKYFRRPFIPFMQQVPPDVLLASARQDPLAGGGSADQSALIDRPPTPPNRTVETQTDYRDSEAQTDPYTPEYVVRPGSQPELLTLATLSYGRGLPAGLAEVEMIERARAKRAWEATLPPLNDRDQLDKRRKMMDEMERKEWALRESEIEKLQEARLEVLKNLLRQREEHHQELNTKRLDRLWAKKQEEKEDQVKKIRNEHIKTIRKLTEKRRRVEGKLERRDVVKQYSDHGSQVYAPLTRIGIFLDRGSEQFVVKSRYLNTYQGLLELEHSLPDFVTAPRIKAPKPKTATKSGFVKRKYRQERELAEIHQQMEREKVLKEKVIKENKDKVEEPPKPLRFLQKIEKPIPRPPTPSVEVPSEEEEERELAIIALQQVIRGRAIQNMMFEGKEKRIELIRELRSTHALQETEQSMKKQERQATLALQRQRRLHEHKESFIDEGLSALEGESLGDMLDFLGKELTRLQEERRIHAFSMLAERQRRIREAEESGRRQLEERRRREEDEVFKQMVQVHQDTVDTYLEDVILAAVDTTADAQARQEIQQQAEKINDIAYELEDSRTSLQSEEIVSELVHGFLLPEVQKIHIRQKVKMQQRKYLAAAHREIHGTSEGVIDMYPKAGVASAPAADQAAVPAGSPTPAPPAAESGSRRGSAASQKSNKSDHASKPATPDLNVAGTVSPSKPGSAAGSKPGTPGRSKPGTPTASKPASAAGSKPPTPTGSRPSSKPATPTGSRPSSKPATPAGSRPASGRKSTELGDLAVTGTKAASPVPQTGGSRPGSGRSQKSAGKPDSRPASQTASRRGSAASAKDGAQS